MEMDVGMNLSLEIDFGMGPLRELDTGMDMSLEMDFLNDPDLSAMDLSMHAPDLISDALEEPDVDVLWQRVSSMSITNDNDLEFEVRVG